MAEACASRSKKLKQHKGLAGMDAIVEAPWQVRLDEEMLTVIYIKRSNQRLNGLGGGGVLVVQSNSASWVFHFVWLEAGAINLIHIHWTG